MYNNIDNNAIFIDTKSKSNTIKRKINCVICYPKVELTLVNEEECKWVCKRCKNDYFILGHEGDLVPEEDILESSHEEENEGPILLTADNEYKQEESNDGSIARPDYMKDSATTKVTYYREE
jgi:hypothetical protein